MLTFNQKKRLNYLSDHPIQNIRDMSLLSLAYKTTPFKGFPVVYRPLWWPEPRQQLKSAIFWHGSKIQYQHIQSTFLKYFATLDGTGKIQFVKECLLQVAKMLSNMTYYVHGDLTIENIMMSTVDGHKYQFYILDRCVVDRKKYCDLRTLYISILELFEEPFPIFFNAFTNIYSFEPVLLIRHIESI
tara:strand:- start:13038 stop:13598 length:561 start_codon:yes stop_codon:yes gene_type:complete